MACLDKSDLSRKEPTLYQTEWLCPNIFDYRRDLNCNGLFQIDYKKYSKGLKKSKGDNKGFNCPFDWLDNTTRHKFVCEKNFDAYTEDEKFKCCIGETSKINCPEEACLNSEWCRNYLKTQCRNINRLDKTVCQDIAKVNDYDQIVTQYCNLSKNFNNKFCACLKPLTVYGGTDQYYKDILNNPICFSADCKLYGYKTYNQRQDIENNRCPNNIQICNQNINITGKTSLELVNLLNSCKQDASNKIDIDKNVDDSVNKNETLEKKSEVNQKSINIFNDINFKEFFKKNLILLIILIIILPTSYVLILFFINKSSYNNN
jgi:hypothetical protein